MPTHDQVAKARNSGIPYSVLSNVQAVTASSAALTKPIAISPANAAYTQADQTKAADAINELQTQYAALRADVNTLLAALKAVGFVL